MIAPSPPPPSSPKTDDKLEIVSISDDEENGALLKLNGSETYKLPSSKQKETTPYSIMDAAIKTSDTSFVLEPVREEQPRPNKLSRSRAPLNQSKSKESKVLLMSLDASPPSMINNYNNNSNNNSEMMSQRAFENGACASTLLSSIPSFNQSQSQNNSSSSSGSGSGSGSSSNSKNDGNLLPLNRLDSIIRSTHDASTTRSASTMPIQSAVTSFANNVNSIEPELVLSPAKLGQ